MTQPAVTFQVRQLEDYLNTRLFDRNHHRVALTDAGRIVYEYAERIFEHYAEMEHALKELTRDADGILKLGASHAAAEQLLPAMLRDFRRQHPELGLRLKILDTAAIAAGVTSGEIDVGVVDGQVIDVDLQVEVCYADELVVITPPRHPLASRDRAGIRTLVGYPFIFRAEGCRIREILTRHLAANGIDSGVLKLSLELGSLEAIKGAVEVGMGVAIIARSAVAKELEAGSLVCVRLDPPLAQPFSFIRPPLASRAVQELLEFARGYGAAN